eukprot:6201307-Pleurochrysis_carterae.AAC.2
MRAIQQTHSRCSCPRTVCARVAIGGRPQADDCAAGRCRARAGMALGERLARRRPAHDLVRPPRARQEKETGRRSRPRRCVASRCLVTHACRRGAVLDD